MSLLEQLAELDSDEENNDAVASSDARFLDGDDDASEEGVADSDARFLDGDADSDARFLDGDAGDNDDDALAFQRREQACESG